MLGSHTTGLLAVAPNPLMLVGPELEPARRLGEGPVVVCVDGSAPSEAGLSAAVAWAKTLRVPLEILTVAPEGGGLRQRYLEILAEIWARPGLEVRTRNIRGDEAADIIVRHAQAYRTGVLVVTTHARTGLRRMAFGSVASAIVRTSPVPVLVVPPAMS